MERDSARTPTRLERITVLQAREKAWLREAIYVLSRCSDRNVHKMMLLGVCSRQVGECIYWSITLRRLFLQLLGRVSDNR